MEDLRSKSCNDGRIQTDSVSADKFRSNSIGLHGLRCNSYTSPSAPHHQQLSHGTQMELSNKQVQFKKSKSMSLSLSSMGFRSFIDPELQRKKRVAAYRVYTIEGKVKGSVRKSFRWVKERCCKVVYGCK